MAHYGTENIRTIALVGHGASGKTTLAEALLVRAKAIPAPGSVERGTTTSDFDPLEKSWQHRCTQRVLPRFLEWIEVAGCSAALDAAGRGNRLRADEQGLSQRRLPGCSVPDQRDRADVFCAVM